MMRQRHNPTLHRHPGTGRRALRTVPGAVIVQIISSTTLAPARSVSCVHASLANTPSPWSRGRCLSLSGPRSGPCARSIRSSPSPSSSAQTTLTAASSLVCHRCRNQVPGLSPRRLRTLISALPVQAKKARRHLCLVRYRGPPHRNRRPSKQSPAAMQSFP
jgi:hypothetical protein